MEHEVDGRLKAHGWDVPHAPPAVGFYVPVVQTGALCVTSGQLPMIGKEVMFHGPVTAATEQDARNAAVLCVLNALAQLKATLGTLDRIRRVVRLEGYVASGPGFHDQPQVLNAASELLVHGFGDAGRHTRIAVGVCELPLKAAVEIALWVEVGESA